MALQHIVNRDADSAEFFDGLSRHEFLLRYSEKSGKYYEPQRGRFVEGMDSPLVYKPAAGGGKVVSWVVPHVRTEAGEVREVTAIIEFDEGPWWWGALVDVDPDAVHIGQRVKVDFEDYEGSETYPVFRPE